MGKCAILFILNQVGDEIVRVNGFTIAEAIHDDVLSLIKSRDEIVLKVTRKFIRLLLPIMPYSDLVM